MKYVLPFLAVLVLTACANAPAAPNPMSVPSVLQSITQTRDSAGGFIFVTGGIYDGAAAGQTANFVVTPDDRIICTFQTDPILQGELSTVSAHRLRQPGAYRAISAAMLPNVEAAEFNATFSVEIGSGGVVATTRTGVGDQRFEALSLYFQTAPTPCWRFG